MADLTRRSLLKAALAGVVLTSLPGGFASASGVHWRDVIEVEPGPLHGAAVTVLNGVNFPWAEMAPRVRELPLGTGKLRIVWTDQAQSSWNRWHGRITLADRTDMDHLWFLLPHELGHAVDTLFLSDADRRAISEFLHPGCTHPWLAQRVHHDARVGERYATLIADAFGGRFSHHGIAEHYGPNEQTDRAAGRRPNQTLDYLVAVTLHASTDRPPEDPPMSDDAPPISFDDVPPGHPHREAIEAVAAARIARGYPDGTFRPEAPVNRGQMAAFLFRALDVVAPDWRPPDDRGRSSRPS